ncbi:MAG: hypothetical protein GX796_07740 [Clostridiaceae bacterium]|nr:hypothetical protein [Clostridiaceae bacterium]
MNSRLLDEIITNALNIPDYSIDELHGGFSKQVGKIAVSGVQAQPD